MVLVSQMETIICTRCHSKKPAEEFGRNRLGQPRRNCINCRAKRKEHEKTKVVDKKPEIQEVLDHVGHLLMNDLFLENYFMIFGKHKDRVMTETPVDDKPEQTSSFYFIATHKLQKSWRIREAKTFVLPVTLNPETDSTRNPFRLWHRGSSKHWE